MNDNIKYCVFFLALALIAILTAKKEAVYNFLVHIAGYKTQPEINFEREASSFLFEVRKVVAYYEGKGNSHFFQQNNDLIALIDQPLTDIYATEYHYKSKASAADHIRSRYPHISSGFDPWRSKILLTMTYTSYFAIAYKIGIVEELHGVSEKVNVLDKFSPEALLKVRSINELRTYNFTISSLGRNGYDDSGAGDDISHSEEMYAIYEVFKDNGTASSKDTTKP